MNDFNVEDLEKRMIGALDNLKLNYQGIRSGRASTALVDNITVDAYGQNMKLKDIATVSVPEARSLKINVWDANLVTLVEKSILNSKLELTPLTEGQFIRINLPDLTAERRQEFAKTVRSLAEEAKISVRNIRQDGMNILKKDSNNSTLSEDQVKSLQEKVQKLTDSYVNNISDICKNKETEIMQI